MHVSDPVLGSAINKIARFHFFAKKYSDTLHAESRIVSGQRAVLFEIAELGECTVPEMADWRGLSRQAIQKTVNELVRRRLVRKLTPKNDKRNRSLVLTTTGAALVRRMRKKEYEDEAQFKSAVPEKDLIATVRFLDWLEAALETRLAEMDQRNKEK